MNRRDFLVTTSVAALVGCNGLVPVINTVTVTAQVVSDIGQIAGGLTGALASISGLSIFTTVTGYVTSISQLANSISTVTPVTTAQTTVMQIETLLNDIVDVCAGLSLPTPFGPALAAASVLLPVVEDALNMLVTAKPKALLATMTPDQARQVLFNAAQGR